jgi:hypothetical protein
MSSAAEIYMETVLKFEREADEKNKVLLDKYLR